MPTVAVWGTGIDVVYPKENKNWPRDSGHRRSNRERDANGNVSAPQNFPRRNRILSGLSVAVLVVEAGRTRHKGHALRRRAESRPVRGAGQCDQQRLVDSQHTDQARAKLVPRGRTCGEDLPSQVRLELEADAPADPNRRPPHLYC